MIELTNLEICKHIAKIEGYPQKVMGHDTVIVSTATEHTLGHWKEYNPLTDDALCFQLMLKYEINLNYDFKGCSNRYVCFHNKHIATELSRSDGASKAICLAIIEAKKHL